ncbi:MAG: hypothetical protein DA328_05735 [Nitrososphaeraceae archaeon]|nr:hypothetical protein [Nitrososphaeraceae archaeon]
MIVSNRILLFYFCFFILCSFLSSSFAAPGDPKSTTDVSTNAIEISKTVTPNNTSKDNLVTINVKNDRHLTIKNVLISDSVPSMFLIKPENTYKDNTITQRFLSLNDSISLSYIIVPKKELDLTSNWQFVLPSSQIKYDVTMNNESRTINKLSKPVTVTIVKNSDETADYSWIGYVLVLLFISALSGFLGGLVNYFSGYKRNLNLITRSFTYDIIDQNIKLNVKYDDNIFPNGNSTVTVSYFKLMHDNPSPEKITCQLFYSNIPSEGDSFDIPISDPNNKKEVFYSFTIKKPHPSLEILFGNDLKSKYTINTITVEERSWKKYSMAGLAAGLIVLLFLQISSSLVTNHTFPANVQSMITLTITAFIAGFIPFKILDRATSQLEGKLQVVRDAYDQANTKVNQLISDKERQNIRYAKENSDYKRLFYQWRNSYLTTHRDSLHELPLFYPGSQKDSLVYLVEYMLNNNVSEINVKVNNQDKKVLLNNIGFEDLQKAIQDFDKFS